MSDHDCNTYDENSVDKFDGPMEHEESGCTIIINSSINMIEDMDAQGLYTYLLCRPPTWKVNIKHLCARYKCGKTKIYSAFDTLIALKLISRTELRNKGKFLHYKYKIFLRPQIEHSAQLTPVPQKPDAVKPDAINEDAYKTNILPLQNKEFTTTTEQPQVVVVSSTTLSQNEQKKLTDAFNDNPFESEKIKTLDDFLSAALYSLLNRREGIGRQQRLHGILKFVRQSAFEEPQGWKKTLSSKKTETEQEKMQRYAEERIANFKKAGIARY